MVVAGGYNSEFGIYMLAGQAGDAFSSAPVWLVTDSALATANTRLLFELNGDGKGYLLNVYCTASGHL